MFHDPAFVHDAHLTDSLTRSRRAATRHHHLAALADRWTVRREPRPRTAEQPTPARPLTTLPESA